MDSDEERILINLWVLGQTSHNDKLITEEERFTIYPPTYFRGIMRKWTGEKRTVNLQRISSCVKSSFNILENVMEKSDDRRHNIAVRAYKSLKQCIGGLRNLQQTYKDDISVCAQLNLLCDDITDALQLYKCFHRDELKID